MKKIFSFALVSLLSTMSLAVAYAAGPNIGISPSAANELMSYELKPGTKMEDSFTLQNMGDKKGTFEVYVVDLDETKKVEKEYTPSKLLSETQTGVGLWTVLSERYVTLEPGQKRPVTFFINVPANTPKEKVYKGSIIARISPVAADPKVKSVASNKTGGTITITSQVSTKLTVKVTDNPASANSDQAATADAADGDLPDNGMKNVAVLLVVLLIISIGYLFYRKK